MYKIAIIQDIPEPTYGFEFGIKEGNRYITMQEALNLMKTQPTLWHTLINRAVIDTENAGNFFEMPKITMATINQPFRAMLIGTNEFAKVRPNPNVFTRDHSTPVLVTASPSGTILVVPNNTTTKNYAHLTAFMQHCNDTFLIATYWNTLAVEIENHIVHKGDTWVSTHGLGVPWLHMRVSQIPRYYAGPYGGAA